MCNSIDNRSDMGAMMMYNFFRGFVISCFRDNKGSYSFNRAQKGKIPMNNISKFTLWAAILVLSLIFGCATLPENLKSPNPMPTPIRETPALAKPGVMK